MALPASNENLRGPSAKVIEALKAAPSRDLGLGYPPPSVAAFHNAIAAMWGAKPNNVMLATAVAAGADAIVTGDQNLQVLGVYERISILNPRQFLEWLDAMAAK